MKRTIAVLVCLLAWLQATPSAFAQSMTGSPVRLIVPFPPGSTTDVVARALAKEMAVDLGQPVVVDNKPGAAGAIASREIAAAKPDGLTIGWGSAGTILTNTLVMKNPGFDPLQDFVPIGMVGEVPFAWFANAQTPIRSLQDLVAQAQARPGQLNYGSDGIGSTTHLAAELFKVVAGVDIEHVPYRGAPAYEADLTTGRLETSLAGVGYASKWVGTGNIRILAVTSARRLAALPDVPTVAESGYPDFSAASWFALVAPRNTDPVIVARYHQALQRALQTAALKAFASIGFDTIEGPPEAVTTQIEKEKPVWQALVNRIGLIPAD